MPKIKTIHIFICVGPPPREARHVIKMASLAIIWILSLNLWCTKNQCCSFSSRIAVLGSKFSCYFHDWLAHENTLALPGSAPGHTHVVIYYIHISFHPFTLRLAV